MDENFGTEVTSFYTSGLSPGEVAALPSWTETVVSVRCTTGSPDSTCVGVEIVPGKGFIESGLVGAR